MTISQTAEYALRAILWLAANPETQTSTHQIARQTRVPPGYLSKVLQELGRAGLVVSRPGRTGGFTLTRSAEQISVLDVVNAVDAIQRIRQCPLGIAGHLELCPLHQRLDSALALVEDAFARTTIAELLTTPTASKPLCAALTTSVVDAKSQPADSAD